jgi:hypothetical protein
VRGIYATAATERLLAAGLTVVDASGPIRRRFDREFPDGPADADCRTTDDRQGVGLVGEDGAVAAAGDALVAVGRDALSWPDPTPPGAVFDATVVDTRGGGAILELGEREGYLPFDEVDGYVETGDHHRVQVRESTPPWSDRRPSLSTDLAVEGSVVSLRRGEGPSAAADAETTTELVRSLDLLDVAVPDGWGVRFERPAVEADLSTLGEALDRASDRVADLAELPPASAADGARPRRLATPRTARWCWFGRESRFALDDRRERVTTTMPGHHRVKAATAGASDAVDLVEAVCGGGEEFPFDAVADTFGPAAGDRVRIDHGKPDGRRLVLGRATVDERRPGGVTLRREMSAGGRYDGLDTPKEAGDEAVTRVEEGRWWYPTVYRGADGTARGTYVNVCTPVEVFPDAVRYVDLHVDVLQYPDGTVERVDEEELSAAVDDGAVPPALAERARSVADAVEDAL